MRSLVVLAAGLGSRFGGSKQTSAVGPSGEWLLDYAIFDARRAGFDDVVLVIKPGSQDHFAAVIDRWRHAIAVRLVEQRPDDLPAWFHPPAERTKPWGTVHAVLSAREAVTSPFAMINADDFYGRDAYALAAEWSGRSSDRPSPARLARLKTGDSILPGHAVIVGMRLDATLSDHGAVTRAVCETDARGEVTKIIERTGLARPLHAPLTGAEAVSMNFWVFEPHVFTQLAEVFKAFLRRSGADPKAESLLPEAVNDLLRAGQLSVELKTAPGPWFGLTHQRDREETAVGLRRLTDAGVYPTPLWG
jgi:UTP-glucose-1-phosphate uridylyltransferase